MAHSLTAEYVRRYIIAHSSRRKDGCWVFTGPRGGISGYPTIMVARKEYLLSALSIMAFGKVNHIVTKDGLECCHTCDNPRCVNPDHIFVGTALDNVRDAIKKGRHITNQTRKKQVCKQGHPLTEDNVWWFRGHRWCRTCMRERVRQRRGIATENYTFDHRRELADISLNDIVSAVKKYHGNKRKAAADLGMCVWTLYARWRAAGLSLLPARRSHKLGNAGKVGKRHLKRIGGSL